MRKRSNRIRRPASKMLTPQQHTNLLVRARMVLQLLLSGDADPEYLATIAGIFNIAGAVGYLHRREDIVDVMATAQTIMSHLVADRRPPDPDEATTIKSSFNIADHYIGVQQKLTLLKATKYIEEEIAAGRALVAR